MLGSPRIPANAILCSRKQEFFLWAYSIGLAKNQGVGMKISAPGFQSCLEGDMVALCCSKFRPQMVHQNHCGNVIQVQAQGTPDPRIILTQGKVQESGL